MAALKLSLLGPFLAALDEKPIDSFPTSKVQALVIYLAVEDQAAHRREHLMELLWPGMPLESAQVNLRQTLYRLRKTIPEVSDIEGNQSVPLLLTDRQIVRLNPEAALDLDVAAFQEGIEGDPAAALRLYRGDFLVDFYLTDSSEFETWAEGWRENLRRTCQETAFDLAEAALEAGDYPQAQAYAWRQLEFDHLSERAYRQLMTALARSGQRNAALAQYQVARRRLFEELGLEPSPETTALYEQIQADALQAAKAPPEPPKRNEGDRSVFLLTDIEGSTRLWDTYRQAMLPALLQHNSILEEHISQHGGRILELRGDGVKAVFEGVNPLQCMLDIQQALGAADWGELGELRIRMGLHGVATVRKDFDYFIEDDQYYGPVLNHTARIMDAGHGGQILVSEQVYNSFSLPSGARWEDFGAHPVKSLDQPLPIYGLLHPDLSLQSFPPLRTGSALEKHVEVEEPAPAAAAPSTIQVETIRHNLPAHPTPLIGREDELANLATLLTDPETRLVTIVGPGGMGKTRLALAAAEQQLSTGRFPDGLYFVPLAPLEEVEHIVPTIASAMSISLDTGGDPKEQLLHRLHPQQMLIIMDNCDHLLAGVELLADMLQAAPDLVILANSRERLLLHGEQVFALAGLETPKESESASVSEDLTDYPAMQLFLQSARRIQPAFEPSPVEIPLLGRVCRLLAGMPLGIELAATWLELLSLEEIADEIQNNLDFLETELRDLPERHRSLRAVFDASWHQMRPQERTIFLQLSVFRGGFTREAAQKITGATLRKLGRLVFKSLLYYDQSQERYQMLELLRQYGAEKLAEDEEQATNVRGRHSAYYCGFLEEREVALKSAGVLAALKEIDAEIDNVRQAWDWAVRKGQLTILEHAAESLAWFYFWPARHQEANAAYQKAGQKLEGGLNGEPHPTNREQVLLARIYSWRVRIERELENETEALRLGQLALDILEKPELSDLDTRREKAFALLETANVIREFELKRSMMEQSLDLYRELDNHWGMILTLSRLGLYTAVNHDYRQAEELYREALKLNETLSHPLQAVWISMEHGLFIALQGRFEEGQAWLHQAIEDSTKINYRPGLVGSYFYSSEVALLQGQFTQAHEFLTKSIDRNPSRGMQTLLIWAKRQQCWAQLHQGQYDKVHSQAVISLAEFQKMNDLGNQAFFHYLLGCLRMTAKAFDEGRDQLLKGLQIIKGAGVEDALKNNILSTLSYTIEGADEVWRSQAQEYLAEALQYCLATRGLESIFMALPAAAILMAEAGQHEQAIELYALASNQPFVGNSRWFVDVVGRRLETVAATLPTEVAAAARERGRKQDLWQTAESLIDQLTALGWGRGEVDSFDSANQKARHNLPTQPTPFIGREDELADLKALIANPEIRLVTIVGPGGMGKTRLALAAAEEMIDTEQFVNGLFFVDLAPLDEPGQMISAVAEALKFPLQGQEDRTPQQQLRDYLRSQKLLLVLDNCEHLLEGVDWVADLLQAAPELQVLATSRERLHLRQEQVFPLEGLDFPDLQTPKEAAGYTAVQLFLQSARRNLAEFTVRDDDDLNELVRICHLVTGMPLALELAASWVDMLPLSEISDGLQAGLDFLESDLRDLPDRHRSLRAAIDHSWRQLEEKEGDIFARLSVFRGGFTRAAAQAVAGANLRQLGRLVNKSFLQYDQSLDRYQIHVLLKQYGAEKLGKAEETLTTRAQHCTFFCSALARWGTILNSEHMRSAVEEVEADYRNIELAWEFALDQGYFDQLLVAVNGLGEYFDANGRWYEGIDLFKKSGRQLQSDHGQDPKSPETARLLVWLSAWQINLDINARGSNVDPQEAYQKVLQPSFDILQLPILSEVDYRAEEAYLRLQLGRILKRIDEYWEDGKKHLEVCLDLYRTLEDRVGESDVLYETYYYALDQEEHINSQKNLQKSLQLLPERGDPRRRNRLLIALGVFEREMLSFEKAATRYEQAYLAAEAAGHWIGMFDARHVAIHQAWYLGEFEQALAQSEQALALAKEAHNPSRQFVALSLVGVTLIYAGNFLQALDKVREILSHKDRYHIPVEMGWWGSLARSLAHMHAGYYEQVMSMPSALGTIESQGWVHLVRSNFTAALALVQQSMDQLRPREHEWRTTFQALLALALLGHNRVYEARKELYRGLKTCVERRAFLPLMRLMPVLAMVFAETNDENQKERALELWAMAENLPFVGNSMVFKELIGRPMAAVAAALPPEAVTAAQVRGRELDWWETAATLLGELTALGWGRAQAETTGVGGTEIRHNLPAQPTPFIGREEELEELEAMIADPEIRLVTIVGPGGMGKTRLALAAAEGLLDTQQFLDGIFFVDLAPLNKARQMPLAMAEALEIQLTGSEGGADQQLLDFLGDKHMLFILDNIEHLLDGAPFVNKILAISSGVQILATSRERLELRGEQLFHIPGLAYPDWVTPADAAEYSAAQVFLGAARRIRADFALKEDDLPHLTRLCQLVGGMPLALELAAGWVELLSLGEIAAEIGRGLDFLETDKRDVPDRQRSMQAVFESTWARLDQAEQDMLAKLSVFRGGFNRQAAGVVIKASSATTLKLLGRLVSKSLVGSDPEKRRYQVHELLRQFTRAHLDESGGLEAAQEAHTGYFLGQMPAWEAHIKGGQRQLEALKAIESDFRNIQAAWGWALEKDQFAQIDRSLEALCWFCEIRSRQLEGVELFTQAESRVAPSDEQYNSRAWRRIAVRRIILDQTAWTQSYHHKKQESERIYHAAGQEADLAELAWILQVFAYFLPTNDQISWGQETLNSLEKARSLYRQAGEFFNEYHLIGWISWLSFTLFGVAKRTELLRIQLEMARENQDRLVAADAQGALGYVAEMRGDYEEAEAIYNEVLPVFQEFGDRRHILEYHFRLAEVVFLKGNVFMARHWAKEGKALSRRLPKGLEVTTRSWFIGVMGMVLNAEEKYQEAEDLYGDTLEIDLIFGGGPQISRSLAYTQCGLGDYAAAKATLRKYLGRMIVSQATGWQIQILPATALNAASEDKLERATELLALAFHHPAAATGWLEKFPLVIHLRERLEAELSSKAFSTAWEGGKTLDLDTTITNLLSEYQIEATE